MSFSAEEQRLANLQDAEVTRTVAAVMEGADRLSEIPADALRIAAIAGCGALKLVATVGLATASELSGAKDFAATKFYDSRLFAATSRMLNHDLGGRRIETVGLSDPAIAVTQLGSEL